MKTEFTIKEVSEQSNIPEDTIRYYEKIGLLPQAKRKENRHRVYSPSDLETMKLLTCLKKTGMPLTEMKPFLALSVGDRISDHPQLYEKLLKHRETIREQVSSLQQILDFINIQLEGEEDGESCALSEPRKQFGVMR